MSLEESAIGWLAGKGIGKLMNALVKSTAWWAPVLRNVLANFITSKMGVLGTVLSFTSVGGFVMNCWDMFDNGKLDHYVKIG